MRFPLTIRLGDLDVCRVGFGAMQLPGPLVWGEPRDPAAARATLRRVVDLGMNLIDTSWYYGPLVANRLIAETLHPYPTGLVIATKLGGARTPDKSWTTALRPEELRAGCEQDLRSLRVERLDVVHLRWTRGADVPFRESLDAMVALQAEGKIRHLALSNVTLAQATDAIARAKIVAIQNLYNVMAGAQRLANVQAIFEEQEELLAFCEHHGLAFLPFCPLAIPGHKRTSEVITSIAERHGASEAQIAIAWLLARSRNMLPIPGTSSTSHLEENWGAKSISLTEDEIAEITAARSAAS